MTALWILPTWIGWVGLTTWGIGCGLAGWMLNARMRPTRDYLVHAYMAANRRADKYRLAWLSARRRAHRGRLLAQLLREDGMHGEDCATNYGHPCDCEAGEGAMPYR
jgi:hypothetical protein